MNASSDPPAAPAAWPAANPTGISPIQHPAWEEARNAILDLAAEGPFTAIIVGDPGTGKSWLLRELAAALGDHGFPTMLLMQGNLPMALSDGAALIVDDASLMDMPTRAQLSAQRHGVAILAGAEWFEDDLDPASTAPILIRLRTLEPAEIADFAAEWLQRSGMPDSAVGPAMLSRLVSSSGGRVGTIVRLLGEAATGWQHSPILPDAATRAEVVPELPVEVPTDPPLQRAPPPRRKLYPVLLGGTAVAVMVALGWALMPVPPPVHVAQPALPPAHLAAALPPLRQADTSDPALVTAAAPPHLMPPAVPSPEPEATIDLAADVPPPVLTPDDPVLIATLDDPASIEIMVPSGPSRTGGPGLALVAQRGDTLQSLYGDIYRDRDAPPFDAVLAANPGPFKPGAIVVFPEPPGGWQRVQR